MFSRVATLFLKIIFLYHICYLVLLPPMAKKSNPTPTPKPKKPLSPEKKKALADKLLVKLTNATKKELKKNKLEYTDKQLKTFVKSIVLPIFRGLNPRDVRVKDIRELVKDSLLGGGENDFYNPLFIPDGDITGIFWADLDDYLSINLKAIVDDKPLRVEINAGEYGATPVFNLQDYQYEITQVNEIYEGIREVVENDSQPEWNGSVVVRKGFKDDGNANSYILQFTLYVNGEQIPPTTTFEETQGIELPKETKEQRRERLKQIIARKKELASQRRKKQKEQSMRQRERPKEKETPATEVKSEALERQENIKEIMANQEKLLAKADEYFEKGVYDAKELKARIKEITDQTSLALSKFKRGGEI